MAGVGTQSRDGVDRDLAELTDLASDGNEPAATARVVGKLALDDRMRFLPRPGVDTVRRFEVLSAIASGSPVVARLLEAHVDAVAILSELGRDVPTDALLGVWAAEPHDLTVEAERAESGWRLRGTKPFASGAGIVTHALVTARSGDERLLFLLENGAGIQPQPGTWPAVGMAGSDSRTVSVAVEVAPEALVADDGRYLHRPGFWHGAASVAACWLGGAEGIAGPLLAAAGHDPHLDAHAGAVDAVLSAARALMLQVAGRIDDDPFDEMGEAELWALRLRAVAEHAATETLDRVGRALGAVPLCLDGAHARRAADLTVYLRQSHAEADLARLAAVRTAS